MTDQMTAVQEAQKQFAFAIALIKQTGIASNDIGVRLAIVKAVNIDEARGIALKGALDENKGYSLLASTEQEITP